MTYIDQELLVPVQLGACLRTKFVLFVHDLNVAVLEQLRREVKEERIEHL